MSNYGFKISPDTSNVEEASVADLIFITRPTLTVKVRDSIQITTSDASSPDYVEVEYTHGFGYIPRFMAFTKSYLSENYSKFSAADYLNLDINLVHNAPGAFIEEQLEAYTTEEKLVIRAKLSSFIAGSEEGIEHTYTIDFMLFMEEALPIS